MDNKPKILNTLIILSIMFLLNSCAATVNYKAEMDARKAKPFGYRIEVFQKDEKPQKKYTILGIISIEDSGFTTDCSYDVVLKKAEEKAREVGADALEIIKVESPDFISSCYRIKALAIAFDN